MAKFGKWIGGGLGWVLGGPIGGIIGYAVGSYIDKAQDDFDATRGTGGRSTGSITTAGDFGISLLVLSAAVMNADGKVLKSELEFVKQFFVKQFGAEKTVEFMRIFKEILKKDVPLRQVCEQIRTNMSHPMRLQLLHYLFGISKSDGHVDKNEVDVIESIAAYMGISTKDFESIKAMFFKNPESAYKILEISPTATDAEVKKAYRKMALKYHPDKVAQLGADIQKSAKEKFQKVQEAYETIRKERGIT